MKKRMIFLSILMAGLLSSCVKTYDCHCDNFENPEATDEFTFTAKNREDAVKKCEEQSVWSENRIPAGYVKKCGLK